MPARALDLAVDHICRSARPVCAQRHRIRPSVSQ
jgi:hypothetical protein